ncbi:lamin Dm0-like isoform X2 [Tubulanus polymorphus]|uniref:lamin Dm0-like isoform X2 n=1 Tax=Tubulanus polymorphus TaxID=672921 RepID=UPI003DA2E25F
MATKTSVRKSTVVTSTTTGARSPSPTRITRVQEKAELANLNDRLANYIDKVRSLESENQVLRINIKTVEETKEKEISNKIKIYETELADARRILDELAKDKAKMQIDVGKYKADAEDWHTKFVKRDRDATNFEQKLLSAETRVQDLTAKATDAENQRKHFETEYKNLKTAYDALGKRLEQSKKDLEDETLLRVDLQNKVQSLKEELTFNSQLYDQHISETKTRLEVTREEFDKTVQREYENKLSESLRELRTQQEEHSEQYRVEIETLFETKLNEMRVLADKKGSLASKAQEDLKNTRRLVDELTQEVTKLSSTNDMLTKRIKQLEDQLQHEQDDHAKTIEVYKQEINELRQSLEDQMREYSALMDIKISLDIEIAAYRKLLEGEEERLNLSTASESSPSRTTPSRATPTRGIKRKRVAEPGTSGTITHSKLSSDYTVSAQAKGNVDISDTSTEGKFVKLYNNSNKDHSLGGWQLKHTAGTQETTFKFHRSLVLKAGQHCTVWGADSGASHAPPSDIVMKQKWFTGDNMKTVLLNAKGEEVAYRNLDRSILHTFQQRGTGGQEVGDEDLFHQQADPREKCSVM